MSPRFGFPQAECIRRFLIVSYYCRCSWVINRPPFYAERTLLRFLLLIAAKCCRIGLLIASSVSDAFVCFQGLRSRAPSKRFLRCQDRLVPWLVIHMNVSRALHTLSQSMNSVPSTSGWRFRNENEARVRCYREAIVHIGNGKLTTCKQIDAVGHRRVVESVSPLPSFPSIREAA